MIRYILSSKVRVLSDHPDLSGPPRNIRPIKPNETVFVNILETHNISKLNISTIKLKCFYPDGHIEEGWTFRDVNCPIEFLNFNESLDGRFNQ